MKKILIIGGSLLSTVFLAVLLRVLIPFDPDLWATPAPPWSSEKPDSQYMVVPKDAIVPTNTEHTAAAAKLLAEVTARELSPEEAARLAGHPLVTDAGAPLKPILVRGLSLMACPTCFSATVHDSAIWIQHRSLGSPPRPREHRSPVIVMLTQVPEHVYVTTSMAQ